MDNNLAQNVNEPFYLGKVTPGLSSPRDPIIDSISIWLIMKIELSTIPCGELSKESNGKNTTSHSFNPKELSVFLESSDSKKDCPTDFDFNSDQHLVCFIVLLAVPMGEKQCGQSSRR